LRAVATAAIWWPRRARTRTKNACSGPGAFAAAQAASTSIARATNPPERLNKEVKRRADVVGIFPNEESIVRLVGAVLMEQNDDWQTQNRYMQIEGFAEPADKTADLKPLQITPKAA
jgi:putative transposase